MRKILTLALATAVLLPLSAQAADAQNGVKLELAGHFNGYLNFTHQDESAGSSVRSVDILRKTEVHFKGETTLDNGLTTGAFISVDADAGDSFTVEDSFVYASGTWGRVSLGTEHGVAYLLQVAAPAADENVDGFETFIGPVNFAATSVAGTNFETAVSSAGLDYDNDFTAAIDKVSYLTPVFAGLQLGVSYTPDVNNFTGYASRGLSGNATKVSGQYGDVWEVAGRFQNKLNALDYTFGAGYTTVNREISAGTHDDLNEWNMGLDLNIGDYGLGAAYTENNGGEKSGADNKTWVLGADYTLGQYRFGLSYLNNRSQEGTSGTINADRYTAGVVYNYGPGMSLRGSVSQYKIAVPAIIGSDIDATSVLVGTMINF